MFKSVNSVSRCDMVRQTVPNGYYPVSEDDGVLVTKMAFYIPSVGLFYYNSLLYGLPYTLLRKLQSVQTPLHD